MFNPFKKNKKKINKKELAGKFFNIVVIGIEKYAKEQQKELNTRRWSRIRHAFKTVKSFLDIKIK